MATNDTTHPPADTTQDSTHGILQRVYDAVLRERLPRRLGVFNGVPARGDRLLDATDRHPAYEAGILRSVREFVERGDAVVVVGGGLGVSSVVAATAAGERGRVVTYEAAAEQVDVVEETLSLNEVRDRVAVRHAVVSDVVSSWGSVGGAERVAADALPACDVLEVDAEGAELGILRGLGQRPRVLIVESHGFLGASTSEVREQLERMEYEVVREEAEVSEKDVMVVTAVHESASR